MAENPNYVRLAPRLVRGMVADVESGWSIAGLDVRKFPDKKTTPGAARFVKKALADGRLEPASKAEWDEVHDTEDVERESLEGRPRATTKNLQEAHVQRAAREGARRIVQSRSDNDPDDDSDDDEGDDLDGLKKHQLVSLAESMGLDASGTVQTLKDRITEARESDGEDGDTE